MHSKGWVHNDVKSANFIASARSGQPGRSNAPPVFVIDLGFAKRTAGEFPGWYLSRRSSCLATCLQACSSVGFPAFLYSLCPILQVQQACKPIVDYHVLLMCCRAGVDFNCPVDDAADIFSGTPDYSSTRCLQGFPCAPCDDLTALAFCLLGMATGR
jgi:serine/threonine protein kinase